MIKLTSENFESTLNTVNGAYLIKFGSKTCGPCNTMAPVLEKLQVENSEFKIFEIDTNESPELAGHFQIRSVPTMHFCEGREILYTCNGITPFKDLQYIINNLDDPTFRESGEFKVEKSKNYFYPILFASVVAFVAILMAI